MKRITLLALGLGALTACGNDQGFAEIDDVQGAEVDGVAGWVCDPYTGTWLEGALVYAHLFDQDGVLYDTVQTETDENGYWNLADLPGSLQLTIYVQHGSELLEMFEVYTPSFGGVELDQPECGGGTGKVAVISGDYDDLGEVLDAMGVSYDVVNGQTGAELAQFLSQPANLAIYDAVFFDGGHLEEDVFYDSDGTDTAGYTMLVQAALLEYVQGGGKLLVTDWSYDVVETVWPGKIDFHGDDLIPDEAQVGEPGLYPAVVRSPDMADATGVSGVELKYDLAVYPIISGVDDSVDVLMRADVVWREGMKTHASNGSAVAVSFQDGDGMVVLTTWRHTANGSNSDTFALSKYLISEL